MRSNEPPRGRGNHHFRVLLVPRANVHKVRSLFVQHLAIVAVAVFVANIKEVAIFAAGVGVGVGQRADLGRLAGDALPPARMDTRDHATSDHRGSILAHSALVLSRCEKTCVFWAVNVG